MMQIENMSIIRRGVNHRVKNNFENLPIRILHYTEEILLTRAYILYTHILLYVRTALLHCRRLIAGDALNKVVANK